MTSPRATSATSTTSPKTTSSNRAAPARAQNEAARELFDQFFTAQPGEHELPGLLMLVDVGRVHARASQPRTHFDEETLNELAQDIADLRARGGGVGGTGILQPLTVAALAPSGAEAGTFAIVAGERRYRAALKAGCERVPVIVREALAGEGDEALWEDALRENIQRENLSPLEEAFAIQSLMQQGGHSIRGMAQRLGKGKGYIEQRLSLAKAGVDVQEMVSRRQDTLSIAREIERVAEEAPRKHLIEMALAGAAVPKLREQIQKALEQTDRQQADRQDAGQEEPAAAHRTPLQPPQTTAPAPPEKPTHDKPASSSADSKAGKTWPDLLHALATLIREAPDPQLAPTLSESQRKEAVEQLRLLEEKLVALRDALRFPHA